MTLILDEGDSYHQRAVPKGAIAPRDCNEERQQRVFAKCSLYGFPADPRL